MNWHMLFYYLKTVKHITYVTHTMFVPCANLPKLKNTHIPLLFVIIYYRKMAKYIIKNAYYNIGML